MGAHRVPAGARREARAVPDGVTAGKVPADEGCDGNRFSEALPEVSSGAHILPPEKNGKTPRERDTSPHRVRHPVENAFLHLRRRRGIATHSAKKGAPFPPAAVRFRDLPLWAAMI